LKKPTIRPFDTLKKTDTEVGPSQLNKKGKVEYLRKKKDILVIGKGIKDIRTSRNRDIKCFCYLGFIHVAS
jgi:hypothetical protein